MREADKVVWLTYIRPETPPTRVCVSLHNHSFDLGHNAMITGGHDGSRHLCNTEGDGLTLGGDENDVIINLNVVGKSEKTRHHQLGTIADGVDSTVFDNNTLMVDEQQLKGLDLKGQHSQGLGPGQD